MKYLRLNLYHIQLENVAFIEFVPVAKEMSTTANDDFELARIFFTGRPEPLEIKDAENIEILKRHFV